MGSKEVFQIEMEDAIYQFKNQCAIQLVELKLQMISAKLSIQLDRMIIYHMSHRIKSTDSIKAKLAKKGYLKKKEEKVTLDFVTKSLHDVVGVRAVCCFWDDIYEIANLFMDEKEIRVIKIKDYIKKEKESGYKSLHLVVEVLVTTVAGCEWVKVEVQLRTSAMDFWANLDYQLRYKKEMKEESIGLELKEYATLITAVDKRMVEIRNKIASL